MLFKKWNLWVVLAIVIALILGIYIRSLPMTDHGGNPGLWDVSTNSWTLGPDLDPFLFLRYSEIITSQGSLPEIDYMRNVPVGFDTGIETKLLPYMMVLTYKIMNIFSSASITYAAVIFPVIMFALTILAFFLFVREIFLLRHQKTKANIIAIISTFFMIVIPIFLARTVAGIPEKESAAFFFMFIAFYLFLKAWKNENVKYAIVFAVFAGISTALMGLIWGGVSYVFVAIAGSSLAAFILNKIKKKEFIVYSSWLFMSFLILALFTEKFSVMWLFTSMDTGIAVLVFIICLVHLVVWNTKIKDIKIIAESKLPKNIISLIIAIILTIVLITLLLGPSFIITKIKTIHQTMFQPVTGRWGMTVAENKQPYFTEWGSSFGPFVKGIPILFWMFFIGSVVLFKKLLNGLKNKHAWILTILYVFFLIGLIFSRYAAHPAAFDGEGFESKALFYISALLFSGSLVYYYNREHKEGSNGFEKIDYDYILLFVLFILTLFTARSAVRLIMVLGPIAPIFASYLVVESVTAFKNSKDNNKKYIFGALAIIILISSIFTFVTFYKEIKAQSYSYVPSAYANQWQKAMSWVRNNTSEDAVFAHWWDYGYWVQSLGNRATVTDGGNAIVYWNYLSGRYVLTGDNQKDSLEFLYTHNASYLLIDSSDIGKYGAFSSIGSNKDFDRLSFIPVMVSDTKQTQETKDGKILVYGGGFGLDEDIIYDNNGTTITLPSQTSAVLGVIVPTIEGNNTFLLKQPEIVFYSSGNQIKIPLRYVYYSDQFFDFKSGLEGTISIIQKVNPAGQGLQVDKMGAAMYISPRAMRGYLAQKYLLNDPFNRFPNFKIAYNQPSPIVESLNSQGAGLDDFVYYYGIQGPIKIWKIQYDGNEKVNPDYLLTSPPKTIDWEF